MAELNPNVILSGTATTNPVQNFTASVMDANAKTVADTANTQANTNQMIPAQAANLNANAANTNATMQGTLLENQMKQINLNNQKAYISASAAVNSGTAPNHPDLSGNTGTTPNNPAPTGTPTAQYTATPTNADGTPYTVDKANNVYLDKDGQPVSSELYRPDGTLNKQSSKYANYMADTLLQHGATPAYAEQVRDTLQKNAQEYSTNIAGIHEKAQTIKNQQVDLQGKLATIAQDAAYRIEAAGNPELAYQATIDSLVSNGKPQGLATLFAKPDGTVMSYQEAKPLLDKMSAASSSAEKAQSTASSAAGAKKTGVETTKTGQEVGTAATEQATTAANTVISKEQALQKTDRTLELLQKWQGSHQGANLAELHQWMEKNPDPAYAELKNLLTTDSLSQMKEANGKSPTNAEYHNLAPAAISMSMPTKAATDILWMSRNAQAHDLDVAKTNAANVSKTIKPSGVDTSTLDATANRPYNKLAPGETAVGQMLHSKDGRTAIKVKAGPDTNAGTWQITTTK